MDATQADIIKAAFYPVVILIIALVALLRYAGPIGDRIRHAKTVKVAPDRVVEFFESQSAAQQLSGSAPDIPLHEPATGSDSAQPTPQLSEAQFQAALAVTATGWRFERYMRVLYPEQVEFLLVLRTGATLSDSEALEYYNKMPDEMRAHVSYPSFMSFLIQTQLVHNSVTALNVGMYTLGDVGKKFLRYRDLVFNGVPFPEENVTAPEP